MLLSVSGLNDREEQLSSALIGWKFKKDPSPLHGKQAIVKLTMYCCLTKNQFTQEIYLFSYAANELLQKSETAIFQYLAPLEAAVALTECLYPATPVHVSVTTPTQHPRTTGLHTFDQNKPHLHSRSPLRMHHILRCNTRKCAHLRW